MNIKNQALANQLTYPLLNNQVCRITGETLIIDIFRGSKTLRTQRKVAEIKMLLKEAKAILEQGNNAWFRHVQDLDHDLDISYSRYD